MLGRISENIRDNFTTATATATKKKKKSHGRKRKINLLNNSRISQCENLLRSYWLQTVRVHAPHQHRDTGCYQYNANLHSAVIKPQAVLVLTSFETHFTESAVLLYNLHHLLSTWQDKLSHFLSCGSTEETKPHVLSPLPQPSQKQGVSLVHWELRPHTWKCLNVYGILLLNFRVWPGVGFNPACNAKNVRIPTMREPCSCAFEGTGIGFDANRCTHDFSH